MCVQDRYPISERVPRPEAEVVGGTERSVPTVELGSRPVVESDSARPFIRDRVALRAVGGLEENGVEVDRETAVIWASIVISWPTVTDPVAEQREAARKMYSAGHSMRQISAEIGRHQHTVAAWTADLPRRVGRGHRVPEEALWRAFCLIEQGATHRQAAEAVGVSQAVVTRALKAARSAPDQALDVALAS